MSFGTCASARLDPEQYAALHRYWRRFARQGSAEDVQRLGSLAAASAFHKAGCYWTEMLLLGDIIASFEQAGGPNDIPHALRESLSSAPARESIARQAEALYRTALAFLPHLSETLYNLGSLRLRLRDDAGALDLFERAALGTPHPRAKVHAYLHANALWEAAIVHQRIGNHTLAEERFRAALAKLGNFGPEHSRLARFLHLRGKIDDALAHYQGSMEYSHRYAPELMAPDFAPHEVPPQSGLGAPLDPSVPNDLGKQGDGSCSFYFEHLYFKVPSDWHERRVWDALTAPLRHGLGDRILVAVGISRHDPAVECAAVAESSAPGLHHSSR